MPDPTRYVKGALSVARGARGLRLVAVPGGRRRSRWWTPREVVPDLVVDLRYATPDNFLQARSTRTRALPAAAGAAASGWQAAEALRAKGYRLKV